MHQAGWKYHEAVPASRLSVPPVVRLLADPVRWRLMRELASGDRRVRELTAAAGHPQNLVSYHLRQLRTGGLVTARRSSLDKRDTYYSLDLDGCQRALADAGAALHPGLSFLPAAAPGQVPAGDDAGPRRVLFVCTGNSSRSPMAEALLRHRAGTAVEAVSAGTRPKPVHPDAVAVMRDRYGLDIAGHRPTRVDDVAGQPFDYVISVCDKAREACPEFPARPGLIHWSLPDPAAGEGGLAGYPAFARTAAELDTRIRFLLPALRETALAAG
jgi:ArsR family transcriptional regulator, arsenate/arsenite/antimonite-responsive transcriptional repressor / arsenate reductase (thioredoxin)